MSVHLPDPAVRAQLESLGVAQGGALQRALASYLERLLAANERMNLTRITAPEELWSRQICDSLSVLPWLRGLPEGSQVVDLGSGGGAPALPLALALPALRFTLVESTRKKARFLEETAAQLGLESVSVHPLRIEEFTAVGGPGRERFDAATARALSALPSLVELAMPALRQGGQLLAIKGERAEQEIDAARQALGQLKARVRTCERTPTCSVVVVDKYAPTDRAFPRRIGEAQRKPL